MRIAGGGGSDCGLTRCQLGGGLGPGSCGTDQGDGKPVTASCVSRNRTSPPLIMAHPLLELEKPWYGRAWASIKRNWPDWVIIGVTVLVITVGILLLILLPGQLGSWN
jgi:hypothetical protein